MWYNEIFDNINMTLTKKPKSVAKLQKYNNDYVWRTWFGILVQRAMHRYTFKGLPPTVNERVLKQSLLWHGSVCIFERMGSLLGLPCGPGGSGITLYGDYTNGYVYGRNGWTDNFRLWVPGMEEDAFVGESYLPNFDDYKPRGVWFREDEEKRRFIDITMMFCDDISDTWLKLANARKLAGKAFVYSGEEGEYESAKLLYQQSTDNIPFIFLPTKIESDQLRNQLFPMELGGEPFKPYEDHLVFALDKYNEFCGKSGNAQPDKFERMTMAEVLSNNEVTYANVDALCDYMQEYGLDLVNKHFGTHITVEPEGRQDALLAQSDIEGMVGGATGISMAGSSGHGQPAGDN